MLLCPMLFWNPPWRSVILWYILIPMVILVLMFLALVESPQFLYRKSKEESLSSLNYIARFNKKAELKMGDLETYK